MDSFYSKLSSSGSPKKKEIMMPAVHWLKLNQYISYLKDTKGIKTTSDRIIAEVLAHHFDEDKEFSAYKKESPKKLKSKKVDPI